MKNILNICLFILLLVLNLFADKLINNWDKIGLWQINDDGKSKIELNLVRGKYNNALEIKYSLNRKENNWVSIEKSINEKFDKNISFTFYIKANISSIFEIKFIDKDGSVFGKKSKILSQYKDWTRVVVFLDDLEYLWGGDNKFDELMLIGFAVSGTGKGKILLDEIGFDYSIKRNGDMLGSMVVDPKIYISSEKKKEILSRISYPDSYKVTIDDEGWFVVNGERFFVKGMQFFENHGVYQDKNGDGKKELYSKMLTYEQMDFAFKKIKEAGFNTIATLLDDKSFKLAKKHGLLVMHGVGDCCFTDLVRKDKEKSINKVYEDVKRLKKHKNILCYVIGNEPKPHEENNLNSGIYGAGENVMKDFQKSMIKMVKKADKDAVVTMKSFPPTGFLDHSIYDSVSINLYPGVFAHCSIKYDEYGEWFRRKYAKKKPFIITEYGWYADNDLTKFSKIIINLLDDQLKMGVNGSFFYIWRSWGNEKDNNASWYGIVPSFGNEDDWKNEFRPLYKDFKRYLQAVVIEPKKDTVYSKKLPVRIYGTDQTGLVKVKFNNKVYKLKKKGKYWWELDIKIKAKEVIKKDIIIDANDKDGDLLVRKKFDLYVSSVKKFYKVSIKSLKIKNKTVKADVIVKNEKGKKVLGQFLRLTIHQTGKNIWLCDPAIGSTGKKGVYKFSWDDAHPGYFTLMASTDPSEKHPKVYADVKTIKVLK